MCGCQARYRSAHGVAEEVALTDELLPDAWSAPPESERVDPTNTAAWLRASSQRLWATGTDAVDRRDLLRFEQTGREQTAVRQHERGRVDQDREWRQQVRMDRGETAVGTAGAPLPVGSYTHTIVWGDASQTIATGVIEIVDAFGRLVDVIRLALDPVLATFEEWASPAVRLRPVLVECREWRSTARMRQPVPRRLDISHGRRSTHPP